MVLPSESCSSVVESVSYVKCLSPASLAVGQILAFVSASRMVRVETWAGVLGVGGGRERGR
jgi:hypothetical protein